MRRPMLLVLVCGLIGVRVAGGEGLPTWRGQVIDPAIGKVCYAVVTTDVNNDGKPDVVAVADDAVVWYENPGWQKRDIVRHATEPDNVCLQPHDVDGDGQIDFALGSAWRPTDTKSGGNLAILTRSGASAGAWRVVPIGSVPTLHRLRWGDLLRNANQRPQLIVAPLQGRGTAGPDWRSGPGVAITAWSIPDRPFDDTWGSTVLSRDLHTVHNLQVIDLHEFDRQRPATPGLLLAASEGVFLLETAGDQHRQVKVGAGDQTSEPNHGASEVKLGHLRDGSPFVATIEPWHGHQFVIYQQRQPGLMTRRVVDRSLAWGHAVWCANLDDDDDDEVVVGQRDFNTYGGAFNDGPGVMIFDPKSGSDPLAFDKIWVEQGRIAVEDLVVADLNADGHPEIVAGGRATHNVKIYWNEPKPRP